VDVSALLSRFQVVEDGPAVTSALLTILAAVPCGEKQVYDANIVATMTTRSIRRRHRVVRLTEARVGIEDGLWLNRIEMEKDGRTASGHVVFYKDRRDAEDFCRKQALTG